MRHGPIGTPCDAGARGFVVYVEAVFDFAVGGAEDGFAVAFSFFPLGFLFVSVCDEGEARKEARGDGEGMTCRRRAAGRGGKTVDERTVGKGALVRKGYQYKVGTKGNSPFQV